TRRIKLEFTIDGIGPSLLDKTEPVRLFVFTQKDRRWSPTEPVQRDVKLQGEKAATASLVWEAPGEGVYGFTIVARNGVGIPAGPDPRTVDEVNMWVEVDETKPVVEAVDVQLSANPGVRAVTIRWKATDKNFGPAPIHLEWAASENSANWSAIENNLPNS